MYRVYAGGCSFDKICTRKKKGATTLLIPSCLKTCLYVFLSKNMFFMSSCLKKRLLVRHANIVQRVKSCYKIKIDSRVPDCCFYGVLLCKQHPNLTIVPLLHCNSATIRV